MALTKIKETDKELEIKLDNGDLAALKKIQKYWKFKNKENVLRFALAIVAKASEDKNELFLKEDGTTATIEPNESLLEENQS